MTRQLLLLGACAVLVCVLLVMLLGRGGGTDNSISLDDDALTDLNTFVKRLDESPIAAVRTALGALPRQRPQRYADVLRHVLDHSTKADVREAAAVAWRGAGTMDEATLTALAAKDAHEVVRIQAIREIARQDLWSAMPTLLEAMRDPSETIRDNSHKAVGKMLGIQLNYDPAAPAAERNRFIELYRRNWEAMKDLHEQAKQHRAQQAAPDGP